MRRAVARSAAALGLAVLMGFGPGGALASGGVRVDLSTEYRTQWAQRHGEGNTRDQDLSVGLGLDAARAGVEGLSFSGLLFYEADLDGTSEDSPFKDNLDSYSRRDDLRLYRAAFTYRLPGRWLRATAGRFEVWSAETATLDGGLVRLDPCPWATLEVFGGRRADFYRDPDPNALYGGNLGLRPLPGSLLELRNLYYIQNSFEASWLQQFGGLGSARAAWRLVDADPRDASLDLHLYPWAGAEAHLAYLRTFGHDFDYDYTCDEEFEVAGLRLGELHPYADYRATLRQGFFRSRFGVGVRLRHHNVVDEADEDAYNVDFREGALLVDLSEWPWPGLRLDGEAVRWVEDRDRTDLTEDNLWGFALRLQQAWQGHAVGAGVNRQAYDSDGAPRDSRGFDAWVRVRLADPATLHLRYERQVDDLYREAGIDALHALTARLHLAF